MPPMNTRLHIMMLPAVSHGVVGERMNITKHWEDRSSEACRYFEKNPFCDSKLRGLGHALK